VPVGYISIIFATGPGLWGDARDGFDKTGGSEVLFQSRPSHTFLFTGNFPDRTGL
jgi:hypothetical protein